MAQAGNNLTQMMRGLPQETFRHFYNQMMPNGPRQPHVHNPGTIPNLPRPPRHAALDAAYGGAALTTRAQPPPQPTAQDMVVAAPPPFPGQVQAPPAQGLVALYNPGAGSGQSDAGGALQDTTPADPYGDGAMVRAAPRTLTRIRMPGEPADDDMEM